MKKVRLLIAMMLVVAALTVGVMAADADYVGFELEEIETGDAITVNVVSKTGFDAAICTFGVGYNQEKWTVAEDSSDANDNGGVIDYVKEGCTIGAGGTILSFTATPVGDAASVVGETFTLTYCQCVSTADEVLVDTSEVYDTLTVKAANVVTYEDKDIVTRVAADTTDIQLEDVKYTNVAKYVGTINFDAIKAAFTDEEKLNSDAGIMLNGVKKYQFPEISATSTGTVTYSVLFYGITPAQADELNISTYYNAHVKKAN